MHNLPAPAGADAVSLKLLQKPSLLLQPRQVKNDDF